MPLITGCIDPEVDSEVVPEAALADSNACAAPSLFDFATSGEETVASLDGQPVAWFTAGSYTVRLVGPSRSFIWGSPVSVTVPSTTWVRTLSAPFSPQMSEAALTDWLDAARAASCAAPAGTPDLLAIAFEYVEGGPSDAQHFHGADFYDYLGIDLELSDGSLCHPDAAQLGKIDCSGYMRLIWGYRKNFSYQGIDASIPLSLDPVPGMLPRRSYQQYLSGPGKVIVPFRLAPLGGSAASGGTPTSAEISALRVGDLVFFDTNCDYGVANRSCSADPAVAISHVGLVLGADTAGNLRFLSSRASSDGPTIGNQSGWSIVNSASASTYFPRRFRGARRL